tara:strand:- start:25 stop:375 length:351 start_codon:yes stop_codon:yes gene_type:complete
MEKNIKSIEKKIEALDLSLEILKERSDEMNKKLDKLCKLVDEHIVPDCDKMSNHINFIEAVYNTVKNPLGFLCNRINRVIGAIHGNINGSGIHYSYSLTDNGQTLSNQPSREMSIQ